MRWVVTLAKPLEVTKFILTPQQTPKENQENVRDEHLLKIIDEIYSKDNIQLKTDVTIPQINALTKGLLFGKRYNCSLMDDLCDTMMQLLVSKGRQSRKEFTDISKSMQPHNEELEQPRLDKRLFGG